MYRTSMIKSYNVPIFFVFIKLKYALVCNFLGPILRFKIIYQAYFYCTVIKCTRMVNSSYALKRVMYVDRLSTIQR
jgi:hypothetical protein